MINLRVLVVASERDLQRLIAASLGRDRLFVVRECISGNAALPIAVEWRPDLVLLDETMPGMSGPSVLAHMRSDMRTAPIPVVLLSSRASRYQNIMSLGAVGAIAKPIDAAALPTTLRRFVPVEGYLSQLRESFLRRLETDARALLACRVRLSQRHAEPAMKRVNKIAHALAGAGGIYGFAGITCESAALAAAAEQNLAGRAKRSDVEVALDRLLKRIGPMQGKTSRYSAATA
jgi:CheY-like chemotaxis protein